MIRQGLAGLFVFVLAGSFFIEKVATKCLTTNREANPSLLALLVARQQFTLRKPSSPGSEAPLLIS